MSDTVTAALQEAKPIVDDLVKDAMQQLLFASQVEKVFRELEVRVSRCILKSIIAHIKVQRLDIPSEFIFTEDPETAKTRMQLRAKHAKLDAAAAVISQIDEAFYCDNWLEKSNEAGLPNPNQVHEADEKFDQELFLGPSLAAQAEYEERQSASLPYRDAVPFPAYMEDGHVPSDASDSSF